MATSPILKISDAVSEVLRAGVFDGIYFYLPDRQLDRKLYTDTNKVLDNYGGKWVRAKKAHVFPDAAAVAKVKDAIGKGEIFRDKVAFQAFYTPEKVAEELIAFADFPEDVETILEPSCGEGALIAAVIAGTRGAAQVTGVEINPEAATKCQKSFPGHIIHHGNALTGYDNGPETETPYAHVGMFDGIVMNPPFQKGQAKRHLMSAFRHLNPGGVLAAIMPANFREGSTDLDDQFRWFLQGKAVTTRDVPAGAFKESGTNIATMFVRIVK